MPPIPAISTDGLDAEVRDAIVNARSQAEAKPESGQATGQLGMVLEAHFLFPQAAQAYQRAIRLDPKEFSWRYYLALVLQQDAKPQQALDTLTAALPMRPDYAPAILKQAEILGQLGRSKDAAAVLDPLLAREPNSAQALQEMGQVKYAQGDFAAARDLYRRACQVFPTYGAALLGLARAERSLGQETEAAANFDLAQAHKDEQPPLDDPLLAGVFDLGTGVAYQRQQADKLLEKGDLAGASRVLHEILKRDPNNVYSLQRLLYIAHFPNHGADDDVEMLYARLRSIDPSIPEAYASYGMVNAVQGKYDAAATALRKAIELRPGYGEADEWLGMVLERQQKRSDAIGYYRRALAAEPSNRAYQSELWRSLIAQGHGREVIPQILPALQVDDSYTAFLTILAGEAYVSAGDPDKGRQYLEQALSRVRREGPPERLAQIEQELERLSPRK